MNENRVILTSYPVEIAQGDGTCKYATFLISVLDEYDRMGRMIPKEAGEQYHETLRGFPIVAKLIRDRANRGIDFGAHEMRQTRKRNGEVETYFDTYPIGSVVDTWIEDREVAGYEGIKSCIMAKAKLWTCRSPEYFKVLDRLWEEHAVSSSWELIVSESQEESLGRKILKAFSFIGNALLGTTSVPAVRGAGIYEYAEAKEEYCQTTEELNKALLNDIKGQEETSLEENKETMPVENNATEDTAVNTDAQTPATEVQTPATVPEGTQTDNVQSESNPTPDSNASAEATPAENASAATADNNAAPATEAADIGTPADPVSVSAEALAAKIAELSDTLIGVNAENSSLKEQLANLQAQLDALAPMKEEYERMEQEKAEAEKLRQIAELKDVALKSGQITEAELADEGGDEAIRGLIANLDRAGLNDLIVSRLVSAYSQKQAAPALKIFSTASVKTKEAKARVSLADSSDKTVDTSAVLAEQGGNIVQAFINK